MNSGAIDKALIALLSADATLKGLLPDGVYFSVAPPNSKRFLLISLFDPRSEPVYGKRAIERMLYAVEGIALSTLGVDMAAVETRIDDLLEYGTLTLPPDYTFMWMGRDEDLDRIRVSQQDDLDKSIIFHRRGGYYDVHASRSDA